MIGIFSNLSKKDGYNFDNSFLVETIASYILSHEDENVIFSVSPSVAIPVCEFVLKTGDASRFSLISPCDYLSDSKWADPRLTNAYQSYFHKYGGSFETLNQFLFEGGTVTIGDPVKNFFKVPRVLQISKEENAFIFENCKISICDPFDNIYKEDVSARITLIEGDALSFERWDTVVHCANLYHKMGAGIARSIAAEFPWAVKADEKTLQGDVDKLGSFSIGESPEKDKRIINLYGQKGIGNNGHPMNRNARYDALYDGLFLIFERAAVKGWKVAIPYKMASDLAGGDWDVVSAIIKSAWKHNPVETYVVKLTS